jgi:WD40 repeat protein
VAAALALVAGFEVYHAWIAWPVWAVLETPGDTWPLAFSADGRAFATSSPGAITLWDPGSGRERATWRLEGNRSAFASAFSPDGRTFAAVLSDRNGPISIALFDATTGRVKAVEPTRHASLFDLAFADDGRHVRAFLGDNPDLKEVVTWDALTGVQVSRRPLTCSTGGGIVSVSPDGRLMAIAPFGGMTVRLWDLDADRALVDLFNPSSTAGCSGGLGFSADGRTLAAGRKDGAIDLWDLPGSRVRATLQAHSRDFDSSWIRFAPDGRTLASHGTQLRQSTTVAAIGMTLAQQVFGPKWRPPPEVVVIDLTTGRRLARATSAIHPRYSPDSRTLVTRETDFRVRIRDVPPPAR